MVKAKMLTKALCYTTGALHSSDKQKAFSGHLYIFLIPDKKGSGPSAFFNGRYIPT